MASLYRALLLPKWEQLSWNSGFIPSRNLIFVGPNFT